MAWSPGEPPGLILQDGGRNINVPQTIISAITEELEGALAVLKVSPSPGALTGCRRIDRCLTGQTCVFSQHPDSSQLSAASPTPRKASKVHSWKPHEAGGEGVVGSEGSPGSPTAELVQWLLH